MNHTKLPAPMDITQYLQTEGRRIAAELGRRRPRDNSAAQQQCAAPGTQTPPRSLNETLQRMGVISTHKRRL
ncbi:MAG: hypothetical protein JF626_02435 [Polaromonas sp.]|nr:hypothetical protein [Polaromonas sp.]